MALLDWAKVKKNVWMVDGFRMAAAPIVVEILFAASAPLPLHTDKPQKDWNTIELRSENCGVALRELPPKAPPGFTEREGQCRVLVKYRYSWISVGALGEWR